jgi:hypothetical protein
MSRVISVSAAKESYTAIPISLNLTSMGHPLSTLYWRKKASKIYHVQNAPLDPK